MINNANCDKLARDSKQFAASTNDSLPGMQLYLRQLIHHEEVVGHSHVLQVGETMRSCIALRQFY